MACAHGQKVFYLKLFKLFIRVFGIILFKITPDKIFHSKEPLGYGKADSCRGKALTKRIKKMGAVLFIGLPPALRHHFAVTKHHKAVKLNFSFGYRIKKRNNFIRGNTLLLRCGAGKGAALLKLRHGRILPYIQ